MARQIVLFLLLASASMAYGQSGKWLFSYELGLGAGWWVYDKGLTDTLPEMHRGYDRTHLSFLTHQSISASYANEKILIGLQAGFNTLRDGTVVGSDNRRGAFRKYELGGSERNGVPLSHIAGKIGVNLYHTEKFRLTPIAVLGASWVQAYHSEVDNFDRRFHRSGELQFAVQLVQGFNILLYPRFTNILLKDSKVPFKNAKHNVYGISLHMGAELAF